PHQLRLEAQFEVAELLLRGEELVASHLLLLRAADDRPALDAEDLLVALPTVEGLAVKERPEPVLVRGENRQACQYQQPAEQSRHVKNLPCERNLPRSGSTRGGQGRPGA